MVHSLHVRAHSYLADRISLLRVLGVVGWGWEYLPTGLPRRVLLLMLGIAADVVRGREECRLYLVEDVLLPCVHLFILGLRILVSGLRYLGLEG